MYDTLPNVEFWTRKVKNFSSLGRYNDVRALDGKKVILGLGSGRCGTKSLATLLNLQPNTEISHEDFHSHGRPFRLSYDYHEDPLALAFKVLALRKPLFVGDVAFYWISNCLPLLNHNADVKCICLKRDKQSVIESYWSRNDGRPMDDNLNLGNNFKIQGVAVGGMLLKVCSECGPNIELLKKKTGEIWDNYYMQAEKLQQEYPNFRIFPTEALNGEETVKDILYFAGIPEEKQMITSGIWLNKRRALWKEKEVASPL